MLEWEGLSFKAQAALGEAIDTATERGHSDLTSIHILQALLHQDGGALAGMLHQAGGESEQVHASVVGDMERLPRLTGSAGAVGVTREVDALIGRAWMAAHKFGDDRLGPEHLVLAMVESGADQGGAILREQGLSVLLVTRYLFMVRQSHSEHRA